MADGRCECVTCPRSQTFLLIGPGAVCTALIYEFTRSAGTDPAILQPSPLDAHTHLVRLPTEGARRQPTKLPLKQCQQRLAMLWFTASAVLFVLVFLRTTLGHYWDNASAGWSWLLPGILPIASPVVTALFKTSDAETKIADRFLFRLAFLVSLFYLVTIVMVLFLQTFDILCSHSRSETFQRVSRPVSRSSRVFLRCFFRTDGSTLQRMIRGALQQSERANGSCSPLIVFLATCRTA